MFDLLDKYYVHGCNKAKVITNKYEQIRKDKNIQTEINKSNRICLKVV